MKTSDSNIESFFVLLPIPNEKYFSFQDPKIVSSRSRPELHHYPKRNPRQLVKVFRCRTSRLNLHLPRKNHIQEGPASMKFSLHFFDRPIAFHRIFVELTGSVTGALLLSQAVYWQNRCTSQDGWWWKTQEEFQKETGLTRSELESARKNCARFLSHKRSGIPCKSFYRINESQLEAALDLTKEQSGSQSSLQETCKQACGKPANRLAENLQTPITETTQRSTSKSQESSSMTSSGSHSNLPAEAELWNSQCGELPKVISFSTARMKLLTVRRRDEFWRNNLRPAILKAAQSSFCTGDRGWRATFDWIIKKPDAVLNLMEGKYDGGSQNGSATKQSAPITKLRVNHPDGSYTETVRKSDGTHEERTYLSKDSNCYTVNNGETGSPTNIKRRI